MRYLRSIITWIESLESGRQFRSWAAILVIILGVIILVGLSVASIVTCVNTIAEEVNVLANIAESLNNIETKLVDEETTSDS